MSCPYREPTVRLIHTLRPEAKVSLLLFMNGVLQRTTIETFSRFFVFPFAPTSHACMKQCHARLHTAPAQSVNAACHVITSSVSRGTWLQAWRSKLRGWLFAGNNGAPRHAQR